jgi:hypothetical protein
MLRCREIVDGSITWTVIMKCSRAKLEYTGLNFCVTGYGEYRLFQSYIAAKEFYTELQHEGTMP